MVSRIAPLDAVLARLIPVDGDPDALRVDLATALLDAVPELDGLLQRIEGFDSLDEAQQDAALRALDERQDAGFAALVTTAQAWFYADPRSWRLLGYTSNVPGRP